MTDKNYKMFERSSEWKLIEGVFKQFVTTFRKPDIYLFASRINYHLPNYVFWRPEPRLFMRFCKLVNNL